MMMMPPRPSSSRSSRLSTDRCWIEMLRRTPRITRRGGGGGEGGEGGWRMSRYKELIGLNKLVPALAGAVGLSYVRGRGGALVGGTVWA